MWGQPWDSPPRLSSGPEVREVRAGKRATKIMHIIVDTSGIVSAFLETVR
jgi:hypothetical protein